MSDLIEKVLLLQELLIARATDTYEKGSSEAFMQLRQELLTFKNFEPYRVCRRLNILRDYSDEKTNLYPRN